MKNILVFLLFLTIISCSQEDRGINVNPDLIDPFFRSTYANIENPMIQFEEVATYALDLNSNDQVDSITLRRIKDSTDPGDFHQIEVVLDNQEKIIETNFLGWVKFGQNYPVDIELRKLNALKSDLLLVVGFNDNKKVIIAFGWVYANEPGVLTIIEGNGIKPKVIFNQNFEITDLNDNSFSGLYNFNAKEKNIINLVNNRLE